jgi:hypothetical protein
VTNKLEDLDENDRKLLKAIRETAIEIGHTMDRARENLLADYGYDEEFAQLAITFAVEISKCFSAKLSIGGSFDDCQDLDNQILQAIHELRDRENP